MLYIKDYSDLDWTNNEKRGKCIFSYIFILNKGFMS